MQEQFMKKAAVYWALFFLIAMSSMSILIINRDRFVMIETKKAANTEGDEPMALQVHDIVLVPLENDPTNQFFCIPVSVDVTEEGFFVENNYLERKVMIEIDGLDIDFYQNNQLFGNSKDINKIEYSFKSNKTYLTLTMNDYYECEVLFKNKCLFLKFEHPKEKYNKRVLIDLGTGNQDADVSIIVADLIKNMLGDDVKVYYSRLNEATPEKQSVAAFAEEINPDMVILIQMNKVDKKEQTGLSYEFNEQYFIPFLGNTELTELLINNVSQSTGQETINVTQTLQDGEGVDESLLTMLKCPATMIQMNYATKGELEQMIEEASYLNNLAKGITEAIKEGYKILDMQEKK